MIELELDNAIDHQDTVAVITRVVVDADDPAFDEPTKFIGPVYDQRPGERARRRARLDGQARRRALAARGASPEPRAIVQLGAIRRLVEAACSSSASAAAASRWSSTDGRPRGVEAVIDKDLAAALLAAGSAPTRWCSLTDVDAV